MYDAQQVQQFINTAVAQMSEKVAELAAKRAAEVGVAEAAKRQRPASASLRPNTKDELGMAVGEMLEEIKDKLDAPGEARGGFQTCAVRNA